VFKQKLTGRNRIGRESCVIDNHRLWNEIANDQEREFDKIFGKLSVLVC